MALAGAIIRTRKEREKKRNENIPLQDETSLSEVVYTKDGNGAGPTGTEGSTDLRKSPTSLKKSLSKTELLKNGNKLSSLSFDSDGPDGFFETNLRQAYSGVYIGLILFSIGSVITFVGLGDKGFKTIELKLIGPILCLSGLLCILYKILQCIFPKLFRKSKLFRRPKLSDSKSSPNMAEKGIQNGHFGTNGKSSDVLSPRVRLTHQSSTVKLQSTVPNFIDSTDDEDDFDPGRVRPHVNKESAFYQQQLAQAQAQKNELLLNPKTLEI